MIFTYDAKDLKKRFLELEKYEDLTLVPLMSLIANKFIEDLRLRSVKYRITNFDILEEFDGRTILGDIYMAMVGTVVIKIKVDYTNICITDGFNAWYFPYKITFDSGEADEFAKGLHNSLADFLKGHSLVKLKKEAQLILKKVKKETLALKIAEFYLK